MLDFEMSHEFPSLGRNSMLLNARRIEDVHAGQPMMLLAIEDITERKRAQELLLSLLGGPVLPESGFGACDCDSLETDFLLSRAGRLPKGEKPSLASTIRQMEAHAQR